MSPVAVVPGIQVQVVDTPPPRSAPTDTGVWFVVGLTEKGAQAPIKVTSLADYVRLLGARVSYGLLYDALDAFFQEGGGAAIVSRVVGPGAVAAFHDYSDGVASTLRVSAASAGAWGNGLSAAITNSGGTSFVIIVSDSTGVIETSPSFTDKPSAVAWSANSANVRVSSLAGTGLPSTVTAQALTGGTDDRASILDSHWNTAGLLLTADLGPGQISFPGRTTAQSYLDQLAIAAATNRIALLDAADTATAATLTTAVATIRSSAANNARYGGMYAPWGQIPGLAAGTVRDVPYSAIQAGMIARNDRTTTADDPTAGDLGQARSLVALKNTWDDATRQTLNQGGVTVARSMFGGFRTYGLRSVVDATADPLWRNLYPARFLMFLRAKAGIIAERYMFDKLDGKGLRIGQFGAELVGMLLPYASGTGGDGTLYPSADGSDPGYRVDVGPAVNTPTTIANGELHASIGVRISEGAEFVQINVSRATITGSLA